MGSPSIIAGLDPGASSGGIAFIECGLTLTVRAFPMPETEADIAALLREYAPSILMAYIEDVHSMPKQGVASSFKFGKSYGFLRGLLIGMRIPFVAVSPQRWTKALGLTGGTPGTEKKNRHKARAQELWPHIKWTHAIADAALIAEYGRRQA